MTTAFAAITDRSVRLHTAGRLVCYSPRFLRDLIATGELPGERIGKRAWKINLRDLYLCLERRLREGKVRKTQAVIEFLAGCECQDRPRALRSALPLTASGPDSTMCSTGQKIGPNKGESTDAQTEKVEAIQ